MRTNTVKNICDLYKRCFIDMKDMYVSYIRMYYRLVLFRGNLRSLYQGLQNTGKELQRQLRAPNINSIKLHTSRPWWTNVRAILSKFGTRKMILKAQQIHMKNTKPSMVNKLIRKFAIYTLDPATTIGQLIKLNTNIAPATSPDETEQLLPVLNLHITTTKTANRITTGGTSSDVDKLEDFMQRYFKNLDL